MDTCTWGDEDRYTFCGTRGDPCSRPRVDDWTLCELHRGAYKEQARVVKAIAQFIEDGGGSYRVLCYDYIKTDFSNVVDGATTIANYVLRSEEMRSKALAEAEEPRKTLLQELQAMPVQEREAIEEDMRRHMLEGLEFTQALDKAYEELWESIRANMPAQAPSAADQPETSSPHPKQDPPEA